MKSFLSFLSIALFGAGVLFWTGCTDPIDVGSDLLSEDRATVGFTDTLDVSAITVIGDSVRTYSPSFSSQLNTYLLGRTEDPFFGVTEAGIYATPLLLRSQTNGVFVDFTYGAQASVDSVYLILPLDSIGTYGDFSSIYSVDVFEVIEKIDFAEEDYYSNVNFAFDAMPIGSAAFVPSLDSTFVTTLLLENLSDTATVAPHIRIPLNNELGERLMSQDTAIYNADSSFVEFFRGIYIKPNAVSDGFINTNLFTKTWGGIYVYYTEQDSLKEHAFPISALSGKISRYAHDYTGSMVGDFLENPALGDSLLFLQGLQGLLIKMNIPDLDNLAGKVINKAELEFSLAVLEDYDLNLDPPAPQIVAYKRNDEGQLVVIDDVTIFPNDLDLYFGGQPKEQDDGTIRYSLNLSVHLQYMIDGSERDNLYIGIVPRTANPSRVIFRGDGVSESPARLKVSFTDL